MSATPTNLEWYIARDGARHGPISDVEMRKFVELGHLRPTDLVWCAHFTEWKAGSQAFPDHFAPKASPPTPAATPTPAPGATPAPRPVAQSPGPVTPMDGAASQPAGPIVDTPARLNDEAAWAEAMRAVAHGPTGDVAAPSAVAPAATQARNAARRPASAAQEPVASAGGLSPHESMAADRFDDEEAADPAPSRSWIRVATAAIAVLLILSGIGWFAWQNRAMVSGASAITAVFTSRTETASIEQFRASPYEAPGVTKAEIDASLQNIAIWRYLKKEFADWYQEIVGEVEKMRARKQDERVVTQFLVDVIVTLRRRNQAAALQSSPEFLKGMASAFVTNLKQLGSRDGPTCYAFISHGEASPFMIELSKTPAFSETLQRQMIAVFSAIVDARASRKIHPNTRRADYDALTEDLVKQRGWTPVELATFSDPKKLSSTPPEKVCQLVQDWFVTQLALKDSELQTRLLAESLKPLVGG